MVVDSSLIAVPWKWYFQQFLKYLRDNVEIVFCQSKRKHSKLFESNIGYSKYFRKWFRSYFEVKSNDQRVRKWYFLHFIQFLSDGFDTFLRKQRKAFKMVWIWIFVVLKLPWGQKWIFATAEVRAFYLLANFWMMKLKLFSGKT